jgi:hypothetical protein
MAQSSAMARGSLRLVVALAAGALACNAPSPPAVETGAPPEVVDAATAADTEEGRALTVIGDALDPAAQARIREHLRFVEASYHIDYRVAVEPMPPGSDEEIARLAATRFLATGIGDDTAGRGLLLWIDPETQRTRVEVGYALEPYLTDLDASHLVADYLAPWFASDQRGAGIEASVEALVEALRPQLEKHALETPVVTGSGGAGAGMTLDATPAPGDQALAAALTPQADPRAARELELELLRRGLYLPDSALYDEAWRRAAPKGRWPAARLREIAALWGEWEVHVDGERAVAYCRNEPRAGPTLLRREPDGWVIDASAGARLVVYDYDNASWYVIDGDTEYLPLLQAVFPFESVMLRSGRAAWRPAGAP